MKSPLCSHWTCGKLESDYFCSLSMWFFANKVEYNEVEEAENKPLIIGKMYI